MSQEVLENAKAQEQRWSQIKNLMRAAHEGDLDGVEKMLKEGVPADTANSAGLQGIHFASKAGNLELIQLFLNNGASVNAQSLKGNSPLHAATLMGDSEVVKLLLNRGAKVNTTCECNEEKFTPLYMAAQIGHQEIVTLLLAHGSDSSFKTSNGSTARDIADQQGHKIVSQLLEEFTSRLQASNEELPPGEQNFRRSRKPVERLDLSLLKRMKKELLSKGGTLRAPAISRRDICPSPRFSPMRGSFEPQSNK